MSTLKVTNIAPQSGNNVYLTGSLTISETLIAKEVRTELTQSVTLFQSGSTQFGDTADDTHIFTGDVTVTGAVGITGFTNLSSSLAALTGSFSSSVETRLSTEENNVDALQVDSASFSTRVTTNETDIAALTGSFSSSVETRLTTAESELGNTLLSSSAQIADDISGSFVAASSSIATDIDALQTDSGSFSTRVTDIESFSSSLDATYATDAELTTAVAPLASTGSNTFTGNQIVSGTIDSNGATNKIRFLYNTLGDLPAATDYHGMFAHVHAEGAGYFAHAGSWVKLANDADKVNNSATASFASTGSNTFTDNQVVSSSVLLTLQPVDTAPAGAATGSLIVSGSPVQLYIYNGSGSGWNRV